jgi:thioredoxin-related protein
LGTEYTAKELAKENGITGLPTMLVASSDFKNVNKIIGYQKPKQFISQLKKFRDK